MPFDRPEGVPFIAALAGLVLVALIWLSTAFLQTSRHAALGRSFESTLSGFVPFNWLGAVAWSMRDVLVLWTVTRVVG
ncbi:MAG: hypothetical protein M3272_05250 [Actinomycetota bacterium]|nr:hypothetical protein [Actinomycetota bacterium]